jgi:hypothetical protein
MLSASDDNSFSFQTLSRLYCSMIFGHYGVFATLPLKIVLAEADIDIETGLFQKHAKKHSLIRTL